MRSLIYFEIFAYGTKLIVCMEVSHYSGTISFNQYLAEGSRLLSKERRTRYGSWVLVLEHLLVTPVPLARESKSQGWVAGAGTGKEHSVGSDSPGSAATNHSHWRVSLP